MSSENNDGKSESDEARTTADILLGLCGSTHHGYGRSSPGGADSIQPERHLQLGDDAAFPEWHVHVTMFPPNFEDARKTYEWATQSGRAAPINDMIDTVPSYWRPWARQQVRLTTLCDYWDGSRSLETTIRRLFFDRSGPLIGLVPVMFIGGRIIAKLDESADSLYAYIEFSPTQSNDPWPDDSLFPRRADEISDALLDHRVIMSRWTIFTCECLSHNKAKFDFQDSTDNGGLAITTTTRFWWPIDGKESDMTRSSASEGAIAVSQRIIRNGVASSMSLSPVEYVQTRAVPMPGMLGAATAHADAGASSDGKKVTGLFDLRATYAESNIASTRRGFGSLR